MRWWKWLALPGFAFAAGGLLAVVLSIQTGSGTVKIELSDAAAKVTVKVDGDVIDIAGLKEPLRLKAGGHDLLVTSGDYQSVSKSFSVRQGEHEVLHVTLEPKTVQAHSVCRPLGPRRGTLPLPHNEQPGPSTSGARRAGDRRWENLAKQSSHELERDQRRVGQGVKMEMVLIPAGEFMMGDGRRCPQGGTSITKPFYLGKYLVTQEQWYGE